MVKKMMAVIMIFIVLIAGGGVFIMYKMQEDNAKWKVVITNKYINIRADHDATTQQIAQVFKDEKYNVLDIYLEDSQFIWYKIKAKGVVGWISSDRYDPYVKELNSPNKIDTGKKEPVIDYNPPILKFYEDIYTVTNISSINYDHLDISDESDYEVSHVVYYEEHPKDNPNPQYWIQYIVTDAAGHTTKKLQRIEFLQEPARQEVKDFAEYLAGR